jgi:mono/diheme cytochrome c family protein
MLPSLSQIRLGSLLLCLAAPALLAEPIIPALTTSQLEPELKGQILIEELNCAACHSGEASLAARSKQAPWLEEVGSRVNPAYLAAFISDPHGVKPGTTMPAIMSQQSEEERNQSATELTHFLLSQQENDFTLEAPDAVAVQKGKLLFHDRGCAACHSPRDERGAELSTKNSVPLGALDKKYSFKSLVSFLENPHASRPSGRMPNMQLPAAENEKIAHFLLQDTRVPGHLGYTLYKGDVFEGLKSENVQAVKAGLVKDFDLASMPGVHHQIALKYEGWVNLPEAGSYTFYLEMNGGSLAIDGKSIVQEDPSNRRLVKKLEATAELAAGWRKIELIYFHTGYEPRFAFEMAGPGFPRGPIPSAMLSISNKTIPPFVPLKVDPALAARGKEKFTSLGCASCHSDLKLPVKKSTAFASLNPSGGCLSKNPGPWPQYDLTDEQRQWISLALPRIEKTSLSDKQQINKSLVAFNCIACHERSGLGGIAPERNVLFTGTQPSLGDQGRIPPPLTQVGAKLQSTWIADAMLHGKRQRNYVNASMPQYGEANVGHLVNLFEKVDELETIIVPKVSNMKESKDAGYEMVGTNGFSCIACHQFNGQKSGEMGAIDITHVTQRLKKNWFNLYMLQPSRFHPTVIMPSYWPGGQSIRPNILGGDTGQQIEAIWSYLADGDRAKKPLGLSRETNELTVSDTTEICRGHGPAGYRGVAVGYPERLNLAFDSEEMAIRQLWKDEFVDIDIGSFRPRGSNSIKFPPGIPFHRLKSLEDNWPYKGKTNYTFPQDEGYQFRGYHLDAARRPTFRYVFGAVGVEDYFEDRRGKDGKAYFSRTMRFNSPSAQTPFYFRAAAGKGPEQKSDKEFNIESLQLRITSSHKGIIRNGSPGEVLIPITLPKGLTTLTLEYQW